MIRPVSSVVPDIVLSAPSMRCGGCVARIEDTLDQIPGVEEVRANLTLKRIELRMADQASGLDTILARLAEIGHPATEIDATDLEGEGQDETATALLRAVAVAGFGGMNVMLLSVSVWSGAEGAMRAGFHWVSALIAIPVIFYSGRFFFTSAWSALRAARMNMDVPIAVGLLLALALSLSETLRGAQHVFFDAALTLTFFLLVGRYLDHRMQSKARHELTALSRLIPGTACQVLPDGQTREIAPTQITPGMVLRIHAGQRLPVDARIQSGTTDLDRSIVTGESDAVMAAPGDEVEAGALNLTGPVEALALRAMQDSFIASMKRMLGSVNGARTRYVRIADRVARLYAPAIHVLAGATFLGWYLSTGDWHVSAFVAISVLIITCPCAMSLAVPVAHVVAAGRLMRDGILMKDGSALERLAQVDRAAFDKTGTLTTSFDFITLADDVAGETLAVRAALAGASGHPAAVAIARKLPSQEMGLHQVTETPGFGIEGRLPDGRRARLGRASWVREIASAEAEGTGPAFGLENAPMSHIVLSETLRPDAARTIHELTTRNIPSEIVSGDDADRVRDISERLGGIAFHHGLTPAGKIAHLEALEADGHRVLMVGDGLNDTPALAAAYVSMSPANATDAGRAAADFVFLRDSLAAIPDAIVIGRRTARVVRQNFGFALLYNAIAVPLAIAGLVTPLMAALAMSSSSILVIANSLRLNRCPTDATRSAIWPRVREVPA